MINSIYHKGKLPSNLSPECLQFFSQNQALITPLNTQEQENQVQDQPNNNSKISSFKLSKLAGLTLSSLKFIDSTKVDPLKEIVDLKKYDKSILSSVSLDKSKNDEFTKFESKKKFRFDLYNLVQLCRIGAGASGEVFLLKDKTINKKFALKTIKYSSEEKIKKSLDSEVKALHQMKHDCIIKCYSTYFFQGTINFVFEYMDKGTLADILFKAKTIPESIIAIIMSQIVNGLAYLQKEKKMIHRDMKPSNILINSKGIAKISDFGVSAFVDGSWDLKKTMTGTYYYMSPERFHTGGYYLNADIWSIGVIVMECALGYYPYIAKNNFQQFPDIWSIQEVIEKTTPYLDEKDFSSEIVDFVCQCLTKDERKRPTATQLVNHPFISKYKNVPDNDFKNWLSLLD